MQDDKLRESQVINDAYDLCSEVLDEDMGFARDEHKIIGISMENGIYYRIDKDLPSTYYIYHYFETPQLLEKLGIIKKDYLRSIGIRIGISQAKGAYHVYFYPSIAKKWIDTISESRVRAISDNSVENDVDFFRMDANCLYFKIGRDREEGKISFTSKISEKPKFKHSYYLIDCFVHYLKQDGTQEDGWLKISISREEIIRYISEKYGQTIDYAWIANTRSNFMNKELENLYKKFLEISSFNKKKRVYTFKLKFPEK